MSVFVTLVMDADELITTSAQKIVSHINNLYHLIICVFILLDYALK